MWRTVCLHASVCEQNVSWEGETANRTSGRVTALINLPPGHKSPAPHSVFHTANSTRVGGQGGRFLAESQSHQHKHSTVTVVCVCVCIYKTPAARRTFNNQITGRLSLISNVAVTHGTTMTDFEAFYLDYVPEEKII